MTTFVFYNLSLCTFCTCILLFFQQNYLAFLFCHAPYKRHTPYVVLTWHIAFKLEHNNNEVVFRFVNWQKRILFFVLCFCFFQIKTLTHWTHNTFTLVLISLFDFAFLYFFHSTSILSIKFCCNFWISLIK